MAGPTAPNWDEHNWVRVHLCRVDTDKRSIIAALNGKGHARDVELVFERSGREAYKAGGL